MKEKKKPTRKTVLKALFLIYALASICLTTLFIDNLLSSDYSAISRYVPMNDA